MHLFARWLQVTADFSGYIAILLFLFFLLCFIISRVYKSSLSTIWKQIIVSLCFTFFVFYGVFFSCEAYFRYIYDQSDALGFLKTNQHWLAKHVEYNNLRFRDNHDYAVAKKSGVTRIGVIGDSLTFGYGIKNVDDRFSNLLEKKLKAAGKKVEVYNLGIPGLDTCGEVDNFKKMKYLDFDIMIWQFYLNDIQPCNGKSTGAKILQQPNKIQSPVIAWFANKSYFINYLYWKLSAAHNSTFLALRHADLIQYYNRLAVQQEKESISSLYTLMKNEGEEKRSVVVIIFPYLSLIGYNYPRRDVHGIIHSMLSEAGVGNVIDLLPDLINKQPKDVMVNPFDPHPNVPVNQLAADKLYKSILPLVK